MHTIESLQLHIQKWYPEYLTRNRTDIVETDKRGVVFGWPVGGGDSGLVRFIPYADGQVGVQCGGWYERGGYAWDEVEKYPDIDYYMQLEEDIDPLDKPAKPLTNYRRY